jgi:putative spermidine/putrescine transport system substrate-binding protein
VLLAGLSWSQPATGDDSLTVVSWGGSYARACQKAQHEPFTTETGIDIRLEAYNGGLAQIRAQVESGRVHWDVVDLEMADAARGCDEGLLEPVSIEALAAGAGRDPRGGRFLPRHAHRMRRRHGVLLHDVCLNPAHLAGPKPTTVGDFFDLEKFPGRRGMRRSPLVNLEFALMADGVPLDKVYATLATPEGVERAFRKLDTIKDHIVWWEVGAQPPQMLADGEVVMSTAYNGRIFNAQVLEKQPFVIVWDGPGAGPRRPRHCCRHAQIGPGSAVPRLRNTSRVPGRGRALHCL